MVNLAREESAMHFKDIQSGMATGDEGFSAQTGNVCTGTRITLRRVTQSNGKIAPTGREIGFMHTLGVTTARSWSGPGVENFVIDQDGHAVFSFDLFNSIPTHCDLFGWVDDFDTFIKDDNVGFEKPQIRSEGTDSRYEAGDKNFNDSSVIDRLESEASEKSDQNPSHHQGADGAKLLGVVHVPSLPQLKVDVDPKQAGECS